MADPLSVTAGVVGIAAFALSSLQQTISLVQDVRGAPSAVNALVVELNTLKLVLESLTDVLTNNKFGNQDRRVEFLKLLQEPLQQCNFCSHSIMQKLKPYIRTDGVAKVNTWRGLSWFLHEKEFLELRRNLATQKSALDIAVSVVNLSSVGDVKKQISSLMRRLAVDNGSILDSEFEGSSVQGSDEGYIMRRFLLESESVLAEQPHASPLLGSLDWPLVQPLSGFTEAAQNSQLLVTSVENRFTTTTRGSSSFIQKESTTPQTAPSTVANRRLATQTSIANMYKVFGVSLEDLYLRDNSVVPIFVLRCIEFIELHALKLEGIYNVSGSARFLRVFTDAIDRNGVQSGWLNVRGQANVLSVAVALKAFLRNLPDKLMSCQIRQGLMNTIHGQEHFSRIFLLRAAMSRIGELRYATLKVIALHLRLIADNFIENKMGARNIAIAFGPTLIGGDPGSINTIGVQIEITELLIEYAHEIFTDED